MNMTEKLSMQELEDRIRKVANDRGYLVIEKNLNVVMKGLIKQKELHGRYYCPCRIVPDDDVNKMRIVCPCEYVDNEINTNGICHCRLYKSPHYST